jgi:UDP-glucose 4-epimerase
VNADHPSKEGHHLLLGGCGFIGRHVALMLARLGHRVIVAGRVVPRWEFPIDVRERITWKRFDMVAADWEPLIAGAAVIHHYAWTTIPATANVDPTGDLSVNVVSTLALLEAMRRRTDPPRLIFASSGGTVYGKLQQVPVNEDHPRAPITAYGATKAAVELYLGYYRAIYGLDCRVARLANPFGSGQDFARGQGAATTFLHNALTGRAITIWGDGETVRDYIHVSDAAAGMVALACASPIDGPWIFNIASGHGVSLNGIVAELEARLDRKLEVHRVSGRSFDVPISVLDVTLAYDVLGWSPRLSFSDGMARTLADFERGADLSTLEVSSGVDGDRVRNYQAGIVNSGSALEKVVG